MREDRPNGKEGQPGRARLRLPLGDVSGGIADLGIYIPLAAALVLVNGLDASAVLISSGFLALAAGAVFRIPFPVQPLKALSAVAISAQLEPGVIHAAGLEIGLFLLCLSIPKVADGLAKLFSKPVIRSLQFGVGLLLVQAAVNLISHPPEIFSRTVPGRWPVILGAFTLVIAAAASYFRRYAGLLLWLMVGVGLTLAGGAPSPAIVELGVPTFRFPTSDQFLSALVLLVIPQIPLTFGNAVVAVSDVAHEYYGEAARRVTPRRVCLLAGIGNVCSALAGGMPMCHGAGGLTAHFRLGARTARMNILLGGAFVCLGLFFGPSVLGFFGALPLWALAGLLGFAGIRHALLVADQRGASLALALFAGTAGAILGNLAVTSFVALAVYHGARIRRNLQPAADG